MIAIARRGARRRGRLLSVSGWFIWSLSLDLTESLAPTVWCGSDFAGERDDQASVFIRMISMMSAIG
jgi:hypothetical protein